MFELASTGNTKTNETVPSPQGNDNPPGMQDCSDSRQGEGKCLIGRREFLWENRGASLT